MKMRTKTALSIEPAAAVAAANSSLAAAVINPPRKGPTIIPRPYEIPTLPSAAALSKEGNLILITKKNSV